jgi:mRNA-degrading endonuclease HigB of HigAB toxin-antitoxin module
VRIIAPSNLRAYAKSNASAAAPLEAWIAVVDQAEWRDMADVKAAYASDYISIGS